MRLPEHIGVIPDGNRRWALSKDMSKDKGYEYGVNPGLELFKLCQKENIKEVTFYGFTVDIVNAGSLDAMIESVVKICFIVRFI